MRRRIVILALALSALGLGWDLSRAPAEQRSARVLLWTIAVYRDTLSPALGSAGVQCRFHPTCSRYAERAIRERGALAGSWRALRRVARCGPWTAAGTVDPR